MTDCVVDGAVLATKEDKDSYMNSDEDNYQITKTTSPTKQPKTTDIQTTSNDPSPKRSNINKKVALATRNKNRKRRKQRKKNRKKAIQSKIASKQKVIIIPKNQTEIIELSSDTEPDSSSDYPSQNKKSGTKQKTMKKVSNDVRNHTQEISDNEIIFGANENRNKNEREIEKPATEPKMMLSGNVSLNRFPLGSSHDCENLANQLISILQERKYENDICGHDICVFLKTLLKSSIIDEIDMIDTQEIQSQIGHILKRKQKQFRRGKQKPNYKLPRLGKKFKPEKTDSRANRSDDDFNDLFF